MQAKESWVSLWMPLSIAYIAAILRQEHEVKLIDCIAENISLEDLKKEITKFSPNLIVINTAFPSIYGDAQVANLAKKINSEIKTIMIGMFPTLLEEKSLETFREVDFGILGEPEFVIKNLIRALENNSSPRRIRGIVFRQNGRIFKTKPQIIEKNNLDELPFPARDLLRNERYKLPDGQLFTLVSIARGCPHDCIFCVANCYYGKKFRKREVNSVINEIEECKKKYKISNFLFWGESFTLDQDYVEEICNEITNKKLKIRWSTASRVDTLNEKLLKKMKEAGCAFVSLGIESSNQEILDRANKRITLPQIKRAIELVKKSGIKSMGHFIFGLPGETSETAKETIKFACNSQLDYAQFHCAIPYPKTKLWQLAKSKKWIMDEDYSKYELTTSVLRTETLMPKEIENFRRLAYYKFYSRPRRLWKIIQDVGLKNFFNSLSFLRWVKPKK